MRELPPAAVNGMAYRIDSSIREDRRVLWSASIAIQTRWRMLVKRELFRLLRRAAVMVQAHFRMWSDRRVYIFFRAQVLDTAEVTGKKDPRCGDRWEGSANEGNVGQRPAVMMRARSSPVGSSAFGWLYSTDQQSTPPRARFLKIARQVFPRGIPGLFSLWVSPCMRFLRFHRLGMCFLPKRRSSASSSRGSLRVTLSSATS